MPKKNILVAIDLSEEADQVLRAARQLADHADAKITALYVMRPFTLAYGDIGMASINTQAVEIEHQASQQATEKLIERASVYKIAPADCKVVLGSPPAEIRQMAADLAVATIVIGSHGRSGLGLVLGSTANSVLHGVPCDVFVVRIQPPK